MSGAYYTSIVEEIVYRLADTIALGVKLRKGEVATYTHMIFCVRLILIFYTIGTVCFFGFPQFCNVFFPEI